MSRHDPSDREIRLAIVGVGNCASSLVQGLAHYRDGGANRQICLSRLDLGGYRRKDTPGRRWDVDRNYPNQSN